MQKSESIKALSVALVKLQENLKTLQKSADNPYYRSRYTPIEAIWEDIRPKLAAVGLSVIQFPSQTGLETIILHASGEWISCDSRWDIDATNPQKIGSAITYMRRYGLCAALGIVTSDEDDDGNKASHDKPPQPRAKKPPNKAGEGEDEISTGFKEDSVITEGMLNELLQLLGHQKVDSQKFDTWLSKTFGVVEYAMILKKDFGKIKASLEAKINA